MSSIGSELIKSLLLGALAVLFIWVGYRKGYFSLKDQKESWNFPLRWYHVIAAFGIYFAVAFLLVPVFAHILRNFLFSTNTSEEIVAYAGWLNLLTSLAIFLFLALFLAKLPKIISASIIKKEATFNIGSDFGVAIYAWVLSFPIVLFISNTVEMILTYGFNIQKLPEQAAVYFLKMTFKDPLYFTLAVITIVILAPLIEEILFRGFLQSFIRQHLGSKQAIFISSLCFSFFHYSPEQGSSNIAIIGSLFALALFLGFVYEKRGSIAAPIALHATFNAISVLNLFFLGGFPKGPL